MKKEDFIYLIYKEYRGMITADEKDYLDYWLSASLDNQKIKEDIILSMDLLDDFVPEFEMDLDDEFSSIQTKLEEPETEVVLMKANAQKVKRYSIKPWMYAAASLIVVLGVFSVVNNTSSDAELLIASTSADETKEILLSDGSRVWLNENSTLKYPNAFDKDKRHLSLIGEAYFEVSKDPKRKFEVATAESITTVLGTSFDINATPGADNTTIVVRTGKVKFEDISTGNSETLKPFEKAMLNHKSDTFDRSKVSDFNDFSWQSNKLSFKSKSLAEIFDFLESKFDVEINDSNLKIKECKITMTLQEANVDRILSNIKKARNIQIKKTGKRFYTLQGGDC